MNYTGRGVRVLLDLQLDWSFFAVGLVRHVNRHDEIGHPPIYHAYVGLVPFLPLHLTCGRLPSEGPVT